MHPFWVTNAIKYLNFDYSTIHPLRGKKPKEPSSQLLPRPRWQHPFTLGGEVVIRGRTLILSWKTNDAKVRERTLWGLRLGCSAWLGAHTFPTPFLLAVPLCNRTGALYFKHIFPIICWGSFNLSLRFIGTGWLLQGSFWMERISCRLGLLPVASP